MPSERFTITTGVMRDACVSGILSGRVRSQNHTPMKVYSVCPECDSHDVEGSDHLRQCQGCGAVWERYDRLVGESRYYGGRLRVRGGRSARDRLYDESGRREDE